MFAGRDPVAAVGLAPGHMPVRGPEHAAAGQQTEPMEYCMDLADIEQNHTQAQVAEQGKAEVYTEPVGPGISSQPLDKAVGLVRANPSNKVAEAEAGGSL